MFLFGGDVFQCLHAGAADQLALVESNAFSAIAENAGGSVFFQNDPIGFNEDLKGILGIDVENISDFLGQHDSA